MEENRIEKKSNNTMIIGSVIVAVLLCAVGVLTFLLLGKDNNEKTSKVEEKDITTVALKEEYTGKIDTIELARLKGKLSISESNSIYTVDEVTIDKLDNNTLYQSVFTRNLEKFEPVMNMEYEEEYDNQAEASPLFAEVKNIYGDIPALKDGAEITGCPTFMYDKKEDLIYSAERCGGGALPYTFFVIDKITESGDNRYVYIYVGSAESNLDSDLEMTILYSDANYTNKLHEVNLEDEEKYINDNYKKFTPYKYTFTKNSDGYYIFTKLEKVK